MKQHRVVALVSSIALVVVLGALPRIGLAQSKPEDEARKHYKRALTYEDLGDWERAKAEYEKAFELFPNPDFHFLIAEVLEKMGKKQEALARYERYLEEKPSGEVSDKARAAADRLRAEVGPKEPPRPVETSPSAIPQTQIDDREDPVIPSPVVETTTHDSNAGSTKKRAGTALAIVGAGLTVGVLLWPSDDGFGAGQAALAGIGGVAAVGGGVLYYFGHLDAKESEAVAIYPSVTDTSIGVAMSSCF